MSDSTLHAERPARERHWVYGFNAALLVAIGTIVIAFLFYFANRSQGSTWGSFDVTSNSANSLAGSTRRLLSEIESRNTTFKLYSLFPPRNDLEKRENINPDQDEHRQLVLDLLQQYGKRSKNISVEDYGDRSTEEVRREVYTIFTPEIEPYSKVIKDFPPLADKLIKFFQDESMQVGLKGQEKNASTQQLQFVATIQSLFKQIPDDLATLEHDIKNAQQESIPRWTTMQEALMRGLSDEELIGSLATLSDKDAIKKMPLPQGLLDYLTQQSPKYKESYDELKAYVDQITKLKPLQSDEVLNALRPNTVVVLGGGTAKVVSSWDLFTQKGENSRPVFDGEQAISSAMLAIARPDKVKVVFVGLSPRASQGYSQIKDDLKGANFEPLEWSPPGPAMPGGPPPDASDPPAQGKGVVWIVFPPEPDPQMMQMGMGGAADAGPILAATHKHIDAGGQVLFMAEAAVSNPAMGVMTQPFPYTDLTQPFGIDVESRYAVVAEEADTDPDGKEVSKTLPFIIINRFNSHEITDPMQSLPLMLGLARNQAPSFPTMVSLHSPMPADDQATVIVSSPPEAWGSANWSIDAKFDKAHDKAGPVPMAAVSIRNKGQKDKEQRMAVIGCKTVAADDWTQAVRPVNVGGRIGAQLVFPGNSELVKNTVLWLAGYENMIAVSARANQAARIGDITPGKLGALKVFVIGGIPLLALALGGAVWMIRRR